MFTKAIEVLSIINHAGGEARIVGGAVRNFLIKKDISDIDIAANLTPDKITEIFESRNIRVIPTGIDFGTVTIVYESKNYEITSLRKDIFTDGRHAKVDYTKNWEEDAARRDFTFNALYMDIDGEIYDYFNGQEDLKKGIVRFIGNAEDRIKEDYLRILRMFRFYAYFGKDKILQNQLDICKKLSDGLDIISGERIHIEMTKLLSSPEGTTTVDAVDQMIKTGILQKISGIEEKDYRLEKLKNIYDIEKNPNPIVSLAAFLCSKIPEEKIDAFAEKWRLSNKELRFFYRLRESMQLDYKDDYQVRNSARINGKDEFYDYIVLNFSKGRIKEAEAKKLIKFAADFAVPEFPVKSVDLINLGVPPSKKLGELLRKAEEIWERANYKPNKEEILKTIM